MQPFESPNKPTSLQSTLQASDISYYRELGARLFREYEEMRAEQAVYFVIEVPFSGMVKIGYSKNPRRRLKQLQTGSSQPLVIYGTIQAGCRVLEKRIHEHCREYREKGEWFKLTLHQVDEIIRIYSK